MQSVTTHRQASGEAIEVPFRHNVVLGIALAAAFPLSWSLSLVALPMTNLTGPLLGLTKGHVRRAHMYMATWTGVGAAFHGLGELVYLASSRILWSSLDLRYDHDLPQCLFKASNSSSVTPAT